MLRELSIWSLIVRLALSMLLGGILGIERGQKRRAAGFRTYMLVCLGATLVMITSQYMFLQFGGGDVGRMGAQVISGIGFLGAGTIILTGRNQIKGLTTAAGLWCVACLGLAIGIGFYEAAIIAFILMLMIMTVLHHLEGYIRKSSRVLNLFVSFDGISYLGGFLAKAKEEKIQISDLEITKDSSGKAGVIMVVKSIHLIDHEQMIHLFSSVDGVDHIEEFM